MVRIKALTEDGLLPATATKHVGQIMATQLPSTLR